MRTAFDMVDVQVVHPILPNPLMHVFCDVLDSIVEAYSQFRKWEVNISLDETPKEEITLYQVR
jgi:hypothetical protein